jgi:ribose transport system ATP-binding protein
MRPDHAENAISMMDPHSADSRERVPAISVTGLQKVYGSTTALENASLSVGGGEIHGLLGENGAGKSTLVRILAGIEDADAGVVTIFGEPPAAGVGGRAEQGCVFIHQQLGLFLDVSVADNIALSAGYSRRAGLIDSRGTKRGVRILLERLDLNLSPTAIVGELSLADQTGVALARALAHGARVIVLDEPTAYLEVHQARRLFSLLGRLREEGVAVLLITHRSEDVLSTCDAITVLRDGATVASRPVAGLSARELVRLITGHPPAAAGQAPQARVHTGEISIGCRDLSGAGFRDVSLAVAPGEVVGLAGLADSGHFEVGEALFGLIEFSGEVIINDVAAARMSPVKAIAGGVAFVPRDRRREGLALSLTNRENIFMNPDQPWYRALRARPERKTTREVLERFLVRPPDPAREVDTLSGGNQQKVLLAKWLRRNPPALILMEPTAGVDLGAKEEIYEKVRGHCVANGCGALVVSSDFREVADLCDRALVMQKGSPVAELQSSDLSTHKITETAYGGALDG